MTSCDPHFFVNFSMQSLPTYTSRRQRPAPPVKRKKVKRYVDDTSESESDSDHGKSTGQRIGSLPRGQLTHPSSHSVSDRNTYSERADPIFPILMLPFEIILLIFEKLDTPTKLTCFEVNSHFRKAVLCGSLWRDTSFIHRSSMLTSNSLTDEGSYNGVGNGSGRLNLVQLPAFSLYIVPRCGRHIQKLTIHSGRFRLIPQISQSFLKQNMDISISRGIVKRTAKPTGPYDTHVDGTRTFLSHLAHHLHRLSSLSLFNCEFSSENELNPLLMSTGNNLKHLQLANTQPVTDTTLRFIARYASQNLTFLDLSVIDPLKSPLITDKGLQNILRECTKLQNLLLVGCHTIRDEGLFHISKIGKNLRKLDLTGCCHISNVGIISVLAGCPQLQYLDLSYCWNINDIMFAHVPAQLEELRMTGCYQISDTAALALVKISRPERLRTLNFAYCSNLTNKTIHTLQNEGWSALAAVQCDGTGITDVFTSRQTTQ